MLGATDSCIEHHPALHGQIAAQRKWIDRTEPNPQICSTCTSTAIRGSNPSANSQTTSSRPAGPQSYHSNVVLDGDLGPKWIRELLKTLQNGFCLRPGDQPRDAPVGEPFRAP